MRPAKFIRDRVDAVITLQILQHPDHIGRGIDQRTIEVKKYGFGITVE